MDTTVQELQRVVIKEELYMLTGNHYEAALLNNLIFWHGIVEKTDKNIERRIIALEEKGAKQKQINSQKDKLRNGWFYKTAEEITNELMGWGSNAKVTRAMKRFVEQGWIEKGNNPDPKKKWDRTSWYKMNIDNIARDLHNLGYALDGYTLYQPNENADKYEIQEDTTFEDDTKESPPLRIFQNEKCNFQNEISSLQNENSIFQNENSKFQNERTIPEGFNQKVLTEDVSKGINHNSSSSSKKAMDDDEIMNLIKANDSFNALIWFFDRKQFLNTKKDIIGVVRKLVELECQLFSMQDIQNAYDTVKEEIIKGNVTYKPSYYATVLKDKVETSKLVKQHDEEEKHRINQIEENKVEFPSYNWLTEEKIN
jgi:hypothetical protein